jgi:Cu2+-containing amine oxidase
MLNLKMKLPSMQREVIQHPNNLRLQVELLLSMLEEENRMQLRHLISIIEPTLSIQQNCQFRLVPLKRPSKQRSNNLSKMK